VVYCLRMMGIVETAGKRGRAPLHQKRVQDDARNVP